jgi:hypothetical protein
MARADPYHIHNVHREHPPTPNHSGAGWLVMVILVLATITALMFISGVSAIMNNSILGMSSDANQTVVRDQSLYDSAEPTRTGSVTKEDER